MSNFSRLCESWRSRVDADGSDVWAARLVSGDLDIRHYKAFLQETYHHAGLNPQIQACATLHFSSDQRELSKLFYQHAISEIGHDLLALNDLVTLGEDSQRIRLSLPLPCTVALTSYGFHQALHTGPLAYLGYLFHLEFLPTRGGEKYLGSLKSLGVPANALSFIEEHSTVDVQHNKFMEKYVAQLVHSDQDLDLVIHSAAITCTLYNQMINSAFNKVDAEMKTEAA